MRPSHLPFDAPIAAYETPRKDAQLSIARHYNFQDWPALEQYVAAVTQPNSAVHRFESAVEAVINGDLAKLAALLKRFPELARARSKRITNFDPPVHGATLLHYIAANGVEHYRQKTPPNAIAITRALLKAGANPNATAGLYGGRCSVMSMLVSSSHPANAGLLEKLTSLLIDFGAAVEPRGEGKWRSPLMTALAFGADGAAKVLVRRGALIRDAAAAAGLGRIADTKRMLPKANRTTRQRALSLAASHGHGKIVELLLAAGADPNAYNPPGNHPHCTPLHQAVIGKHMDVIRILVEHGARLDVKDTLWHSTPAGWAGHFGHTEIVEYLRR